MLIAAANKTEAIKQARQTAFFRHTGFKDAPSHIDDKYGVDVDEVYKIKDILPYSIRKRYSLILTKEDGLPDDNIHLGYFKLDAVDKWSGNV